MPTTLRQTFDHQLAELQQEVLRMGVYVVEMLDLAMQSLLRRDITLANRVVNMDDAADRMDLDIEHTCMRLLALQQPVARDLRIIGTSIKVITDLERIGDFSVDIAKTARRMAREGHSRICTEIPALADCVRALVREALSSYASGDLESVRRAVAMDDDVDRYYDEIFTLLVNDASADAARVRESIWCSHIIHFLERVADHAVNVAERVYYRETGEFEQLARSHKTEMNQPPDGQAGA